MHRVIGVAMTVHRTAKSIGSVRPRHMSFAPRTGAAILAMLVACGEPTSPSDGSGAARSSSAALAPPRNTITLITGDRVTLLASGQAIAPRVERPAGAPTPRIMRARVEASFDDGATWTAIPLVLIGDRALGLVIHPPGATHASLRGTAADVEGNEVDQTIVRAYAIAPR